MTIRYSAFSRSLRYNSSMAIRSPASNPMHVGGFFWFCSRLEVAVQVAVLADVPIPVNVIVSRDLKLIGTLFDG